MLRIKFELNGEKRDRSPFASCILIFGKDKENYAEKIVENNGCYHFVFVKKFV